MLCKSSGKSLLFSSIPLDGVEIIGPGRGSNVLRDITFSSGLIVPMNSCLYSFSKRLYSCSEPKLFLFFTRYNSISLFVTIKIKDGCDARNLAFCEVSTRIDLYKTISISFFMIFFHTHFFYLLNEDVKNWISSFSEGHILPNHQTQLVCGVVEGFRFVKTTAPDTYHIHVCLLGRS